MAILSLSLYPVVFLLHLSSPNKLSSQNEYLATLLAHHATETLIAKKALNSNYLPKIAKAQPVVVKTNSIQQGHSYFKGILPQGQELNETTDPILFWAFKPFTMSLDNYLLDKNLFKAICKIHYTKDGKNMQVFFERLLTPEDSHLDQSHTDEGAGNEP